MKKSKNNNAKKMEKRKEKSLNNTKKSNKYVNVCHASYRLLPEFFCFVSQNVYFLSIGAEEFNKL